MRFSLLQGLVALTAVQTVAGSSWFGRTVYNKWHETELERWLADNNVPYPTPADRKDLENLIKDNWNDKVVTPYNSWDANQLSKYISSTGESIKDGAVKNKDALVSQVQASWKGTEDSVNDAYSNSKDWIFDTWSDSQLKAFCDRNNIPVPQPRNRDVLLKTVRSNYQTAANKMNEYYAYPGDWIYASWTNSDLKAWADERGIPVPLPNKRDELIATVRRNSYSASQALSSWSSAIASSAAAATQSVSDAVFETWSESQLKKWADERGIKVPQGSKKNELIALARKHNAKLNAEASKYSASAASAYGAATSKAGNDFAQATNDATLKLENLRVAVWEYIDWAKKQVGLAEDKVEEARSSAYKSASSVSKSVSKSASSAASSASKKATKAYDEL